LAFSFSRGFFQPECSCVSSTQIDPHSPGVTRPQPRNELFGFSRETKQVARHCWAGERARESVEQVHEVFHCLLLYSVNAAFCSPAIFFSALASISRWICLRLCANSARWKELTRQSREGYRNTSQRRTQEERR